MQVGIWCETKVPDVAKSYIGKMQNPITNVGLPKHIPHQPITDSDVQIYGYHTYPNPYPLHGYKLLKETLELCDNILVILDNPNPALFIYVNKFGKKVRYIIKNELWSTERLNQYMSQHDKTSIYPYYQKLMSDMPKVYSDDELFTTPVGIKLRGYQQMLLDFAIERKRVGLFVDMGLGKTLSTIAIIDTLFQQNRLDPTKPILVVAPIMVALDTWSREAQKWGYDWDVLVNIKLPVKKRNALFERLTKPMEKPTLVTTNPAQLQSLIDYFGHRPLPFQMVIVDELSQFKSATAQRFQTMLQITRHVEYFIGLTGTPSPNSLLDIWSQMMVIDPMNKQYLGENFFAYRDRFFMPAVVSRDGIVYKYKLKPGAKKRIYEALKPTVVSLQSEGIIDLPDIIYTNRYVQLPKAAMKTYETLDNEVRKQLQNSDGVTFADYDIANGGVLTGKLAQLSSGAIYNETANSKIDYTIYHTAKIDALLEMIETATSPMLVFFYFQSEFVELTARFKKAKVDYAHLDPNDKNVQSIITKWNEGNIPVLLVHPASAGHGLNLQDGGHTIVWLTTTWSNEQYRQANKRLHRSGQKHPVSVIHIVAENTIDEEIIHRIDTNEAGQQDLLAALKR